MDTKSQTECLIKTTIVIPNLADKCADKELLQDRSNRF